MQDRLSREQYFSAELGLLSSRSTCERGHVSAIIVRGNRIISSGYNGAPPGMDHCLDEGCLEETIYGKDEHPVITVEGCTRAIHAEANAISWAARNGIACEGAEMWGKYSPCRPCAQLIVAAGITKFTYLLDYRAARLDILKDAGLEVVYYG